MTFKETLDEAVKNARYDQGIPSIILEALYDAEEVHDEVQHEARWYSLHRTVYRQGHRFWAVEYNRPSTENQDWDTEGYNCYEVLPVRKTVIDYAPIAKAL